MWRKTTHLDGFLHHLTSGRELSHWMCSHGSFGLSVIPFPCWMRRHMFVFTACIIRDYFDASFSCEQTGNPCLLDDSYPYSGRVWDFHPWHLSLIDFIFDSCVHWVHKKLPRRLERLVWIWPHLWDMYFIMENLSMIKPILEGDILLCHLHDLVIIHNVIDIVHI